MRDVAVIVQPVFGDAHCASDVPVQSVIGPECRTQEANAIDIDFAVHQPTHAEFCRKIGGTPALVGDIEVRSD